MHARTDPACILGGLVPHNPLDPLPLMEVERERGRRGRGEEKEWLKEKEVNESPSNLTLDLSQSACAKSFHLGYTLTSSEHLPPLRQSSSVFVGWVRVANKWSSLSLAPSLVYFHMVASE